MQYEPYCIISTTQVLDYRLSTKIVDHDWRHFINLIVFSTSPNFKKSIDNIIYSKSALDLQSNQINISHTNNKWALSGAFVVTTFKSIDLVAEKYRQLLF